MSVGRAADQGYRFGRFRLDPLRRILRRDGEPVTVSPKAFEVLEVLVRHAPELITKEEILRQVWPNLTIEENNLTHHVSVLRRVLGETAGQREFILTVPGRGYRFIAPVEPVGSEPSVPEQAAALPVEAGRSWRRPWILGGLLVAVAAAGAIVAPSSIPSLAGSQAVQLTHFGMAENVVTDGARLYITQRKGAVYSIVETPVKGGDPVEVPTPFRNATVLDIAPDHTSLLINSFANDNDDRALWILPLAGGSPRRLDGAISRYAAFSPDGQTIAFGHNFELRAVHTDGTGMRVIANMARFTRQPLEVAWSADGGTLRFSAIDPVNGGATMWQVKADGSNLTRFLDKPQNRSARWGEGQDTGFWTTDGEYFVYREAYYPNIGIWAARERPVFGRLGAAPPSPVFSSGLDLVNLYPSPDGKRFYAVGRMVEVRELARYDLRARQFVPFAPQISASSVQPSPDGRSIVYTEHPDGTLWRAREDGTARVQLTVPPMQAFHPVWSPDGSQIAFHSLKPGHPGKISIIAANGGPVRELLDNSSSSEDVPNWSADGHSLMFGQSGWSPDGGRGRVLLMDLRTNAVAPVPGSEDKGPPAWSPDGRYIAAQSADFHHLMLFDYQTGHWTEIASGGFIHNPQWSRNGEFLFFQDPSDGEGMPIFRYSLRTHALERFADRSAFLRADISRWSLSALTPDGLPIVVIAHSRNDVYAVNLTRR